VDLQSSKKTWTIWRYIGAGKCAFMGNLVATEKAMQKALAELPDEERENVFARAD
jgi:hypothetical protein